MPILDDIQRALQDHVRFTGAAVLLGAGFDFASDGPLNTVAGNPAMPGFVYA